LISAEQLISANDIDGMERQQAELVLRLRRLRATPKSKKKQPPLRRFDAEDGFSSRDMPTFSHRFKTVAAATTYAKFGSCEESQTSPHYECVVVRTRLGVATLNCRQCGPNGVQRRLDGNLVIEFGEHDHDIEASPTKRLRRRFSEEEKAFLRPKVLTKLPFEVWQEAQAAGFDITIDEIRHKAKNASRHALDHDLEQWIESQQAKWKEMGILVSFDGNAGSWAVCISSPELIDVDLSADDVMTFDGNARHNKMKPSSGRGTTILLGKIKNALKAGNIHTYKFLALLLISSEEGPPETLMGLKLFACMRVDKGRSIPKGWILDCQYGGRDAVIKLFEWLHELFKRMVQIIPELGTCYFHASSAIRLHKSEIPNFDQFSQEFRILADIPPKFFDAVSATLRKEWGSRVECDAFINDYFIPTWMETYSGWRAACLGIGTPRVSHEGSWPIYHRLLGDKKLSPENMIKVVIAKVIPYYEQHATSTRTTRRPLDTRMRQAAVKLALEDGQKIMSRMIDDSERFFTRRRVLCIGRPIITDNDVTVFLKIVARLEHDKVCFQLNVTRCRCHHCLP
jgi:hypothetical protein